MLLTTTGIVTITIGLLVSCLLTIYLFYLRINGTKNAGADALKKEFLKPEVSETETIEKAGADKKNDAVDKKGKKKNRKSSGASKAAAPVIAATSASAGSSVSASDEEEQGVEDILLLAQLRGHDVSGLRKRSPVMNESARQSAPVSRPVPVATATTKRKPATAPAASSMSSSSSSSSSSLASLTPEEIAFVSETTAPAVAEAALEAENVAAIEPEPVVRAAPVTVPTATVSSESAAWSHRLSKEEEAAKTVKNKLLQLQGDLEASEATLDHRSRSLEQAQRRISLLEQELKEQRQLAQTTRSTTESQLISLRSVNRDMAAKLASIETGSVDGGSARVEADRLREAVNRLEHNMDVLQVERDEAARELSTTRAALEAQTSQLSSAESWRSRAQDAEEQLEELRRAASLSHESQSLEIVKLRSELQKEVDFHRAEHANSMGASTALHQEISQLQRELEEERERSRVAEAQSLQAEPRRPEAETADDELTLQQLAEAQQKIEALQADLSREIKRGEVAKRVYEMKLAEALGVSLPSP